MYFNWESNPNQDKQIGLIAQQVKDIVPEVVAGSDKEGYGISYGNLSALLIEVTKEQNNILNDSLTQISPTLDSAINQAAFQATYNSIKTANLEKYNNLETAEMEDISFHDFSSLDNQVSSNLDNLLQQEDYVQGDYVGTDFKEIEASLDTSIDTSNYQNKTAYLEFNLYTEDADTIIDITTELGNQMDSNELEWSKANHPYLLNGWNKVTLPFNLAIEHGEVDWSDVKYFRTSFNLVRTPRL